MAASVVRNHRWILREERRTVRTSLLALCALIALAAPAQTDDTAPSKLLVCGTYEVLHYEDAFARDLLPGSSAATMGAWLG
jgi:hypothetical protein